MRGTATTDTGTAALVAELTALGGELRLGNGAIEIRMPEGGIPDDLRTQLRRNQESLLAMLQAETPGSDEGGVSAAPMQRAYWIGELGGLGLACPAIYSLEIEVPLLEPEDLRTAAKKVIARHSILRSKIDDEGILDIDPNIRMPKLDILDLSEVSEEDQEDRLTMFRETMRRYRFQFEETEPFTMGLVRYRSQAKLFLTLPLWRFDAASTRILIDELLLFAQGKQVLAPAKGADFTRFAKEWSQFNKSDRYRRDWAYWEGRVESLPASPPLPLVQGAKGSTTDAMQHIYTILPTQEWSALKSEAAKRSLTGGAVAMAVYCSVLSRLSGSEHFTITCLQSMRDMFGPEAENTMGNFGETLCLEVDLRDTRDFVEFATVLQRQAWRDRSHTTVSGTDVAATWRRLRGQDDGPTFPVTFTMAPDYAGASATANPSSGRLLVPQVHLDHQVFETAEGAVLNIDFREGVYPDGLQEIMLEAYRAALSALATDPNSWSVRWPGRCSELPVMEKFDAAPAQGERLEDAFLENARLHPDQVAVICGDLKLTYGELYKQVVVTAKALNSQGVSPGDRVAIVMEKGWQEIVAVLATVLADAIYVPIHPDIPVARREAMVSRCGILVILTEDFRTQGDSLDGFNPNKVISVGLSILETHEAVDLPQRSNPTAYIIHTSGTTGVPKGVTVSHRASLNTIKDLEKRFNVSSSDRCFAISQLGFDLSVYDIFGLLASGGAIVIPTGDEVQNPADWASLCQRHGVTIWNSVPALMQLALEGGMDKSGSLLRLIMLSGDWIPVDIPSRLHAVLPQALVVSLGGATEAAIWSILYEINEVDPSWCSIPYGHAMDGQAVFVLDDDSRLCQTFEPGRLFIAGIGLADGYWGDREQTEARFVEHASTGMKMYHTGDLGRYLPDGSIEFLGREDNQVKIQGFRIECGDIETALVSCGIARQAAVVPVPDGAGGKMLCAYVVPTHAKDFDADKTRNELARLLPAYMVPMRYVAVDAFPLNSNGKVDRSKLSELGDTEVHEPVATTDRTPPRDALEEQLHHHWKEVLDIEELGVEERFFDIGGTSFAGMRLMARLTRIWDERPLSLGALVAHPTIASLAAYLQEAQTDTGELLRLGGVHGARPLVLLPPIGGNIACYSNFISELEGSFDIYALTARGLDGRSKPLTSIPEMGETYSQIVEGALPDRNPLLAGWSMGGLIAIEIARAMRQHGRWADIATIDSRFSDMASSSSGNEDLEDWLADITAMGGDAATIRSLLANGASAEDGASGAEAEAAQSALKVFSSHRLALAAYRPKMIGGEALTILAERDGPGPTELQSMFDLTEKIALDADHYSIMQGDAIRDIAVALRAYADRLALREGGRERLWKILTDVKGQEPRNLNDQDHIGTNTGFSSIEVIRVISRVEQELDIDLVGQDDSLLRIDKLSDLLGAKQ